MLVLRPFHGRHNPDEEMNDWGFDGPSIPGVVAIAATYQNNFRLIFGSAEAYQEAKNITGWPDWDENSLEMQFFDDLLLVGGKFYGDWMLKNED